MSEPCKVFLSSTGADLQEWRNAAYEAVQLAGATCIRMEDFNADPRPPAEVCAAEVLGSNFVVGLIGFHYGGRVPPEKNRSFTQMEIETAEVSGIDRFLYVAPDGAVPAVGQAGADLDAQTAFRDRILQTVTVGRPEHWSDKYRLAMRILSVVFKRCRPDAPGIEHYAATLQIELKEKQEAAVSAAPDEIKTALQEKAAIEAKLSDIESAYKAAEETIAGLRATVEQFGNDLGAERLAQAEVALEERDFDTADALLKEIEDDGGLEVLRVANAAFQRGKIAEEQVRWAAAAEHFAKAARLDEWNFEAHSKAGEFAWRAGEYAAGESIIRRLFVIADEKFAGQTPERGTAYNNLGVILSARGQHAEAEQLLREAIKIRENALGAVDRYFAETLNNLASLLRAMGRYAEAEPLYRQALAIGKAMRGEGHPDYATDLNNLARLLKAMGRYAEAEPLYRQAQEIDKATLGEKHPDYAIDLNNLAGLLETTGRYGEAEPLFRQALEIVRAALGDDHPNTQSVAGNYAILLREHSPDDPALSELQAAFGADIGR